MQAILQVLRCKQQSSCIFITSRNLKKTREEWSEFFSYLTTGTPNSFCQSVQIQWTMKFLSQLYSTKFPGINLNIVGIEMGNFPTGQDLSCDSPLWREDISQHLWENGNRFCFITLRDISLQRKQQPTPLQGSCCQTNRMLKTTESRSRWAGH